MMRINGMRTTEHCHKRASRAKSKLQNLSCFWRIILCKVHVHSGGHHAIVPRVDPVTPVEGSPTADVVDHAAEELYLPPLGCPGMAIA